MTEFVGRTGSRRVYSYPERPRGSDLQLLARNYASGPKVGVEIEADPGTLIEWNSIDAPAGPTPDEDIPITPRSTGVLLITGVIVLTNSTGGPIGAVTYVEIDGVIVNPPLSPGATVPDSSQVSIPIHLEVSVPVGATSIVTVRLQGEGLFIVADSSTLNVAEVVVATG